MKLIVNLHQFTSKMDYHVCENNALTLIWPLKPTSLSGASNEDTQGQLTLDDQHTSPYKMCIQSI